MGVDVIIGDALAAVFAMMAISSEAVNTESLPVSLRTYAPATLKAAVVEAEAALPNVTVPGPLTLLEAAVTGPPMGNPSSLTEPVRVALDGNEMV